MDEINDTSPEKITNNILPLHIDRARIDFDEEISDRDFQGLEFGANTSINVKGSNDVVIGNVTQFHGPVTIYQNTSNNSTQIETKCIKPENNERNESKLVATETFSGKPLSNLSEVAIRKKTFILGLIFAALVFISLSVILGLWIRGNLNQDAPSNGSTDKHQLITRSVWGGRPPLYTRKIHQPTKYVIISHTASNYCKTLKECSRIVAQAQSQHVSELGSPDVGYNFLIGGDENIYVGRGWDAANFHMENSIGISFIGNFIYDRLTPGMTEAAQQLLKSGVDNGKLDKDYKLVAHNQTWNTLSPGDNVYAAIRFWPHYTSEIVPITP